ncbi:MAG: hypothetical protein HGA43_16625 [Nitrospirae bacterium]|nr:hypothetical protein [Nitrospirota bacterium]
MERLVGFFRRLILSANYSLNGGYRPSKARMKLNFIETRLMTPLVRVDGFAASFATFDKVTNKSNFI